MEQKNIAVIIILYNPSAEDIGHAKQIAAEWQGVIVDNSTKGFTDDIVVGNMRYICNHNNLGIAEAQNIAIHYIMAHQKASHIVFLDQDTRISVNYPAEIYAEFKRIQKSRKNLVLLGPTAVNLKTHQEYASAIHHYSTDNLGFSLRQQIICSGSCISREALQKVGMMDSCLFIDYVDFEWCWRAISKGYECGITSNVCISHHVGKRELSFGKYKVIISAPFRYFYQYRNYLWLLHRAYVPLRWKLSFGIKLSARFLYFPLFVKGGYERWKQMKKGVIAGFSKKGVVK